MSIEGIFYVYADVSDLARAKRFYADTLGWTLHTDEAEVAGFWFGSGYLVARKDAAAATERGSGGMHVAVKVEDVEAEHARLAGLGVQVGELQVKPWGERSFNFTDPDGYLWVYAEGT
jgi:catechol 2,3-dioxygenase-like lactoylglutathione lyase family enzyme